MPDRLPGEDADAPAPELSALSPREREVLDAALEGLSARAIATRLSLSEATVRSHLSAIYSKLEVGGRVELLARLIGKASSPSPVHETTIETDDREPRDDRPKNRRAVLVAVVTVAVLTTAAFLVVQLSSPHQSDLATVSRLIASNAVVRLDLSGSTLTVTQKGGEQLRIESVGVDEFQPIQIAAANASIPVTASSAAQPPLATQLAVLATLSIPVVLLVAVLLVLVRLIRRAPPVRFAG